MKHISLSNLKSKQSVNQIWPICHIAKEKYLLKNFTKTAT